MGFQNYIYHELAHQNVVYVVKFWDQLQVTGHFIAQEIKKLKSAVLVNDSVQRINKNEKLIMPDVSTKNMPHLWILANQKLYLGFFISLGNTSDPNILHYCSLRNLKKP